MKSVESEHVETESCSVEEKEKHPGEHVEKQHRRGPEVTGLEMRRRKASTESNITNPEVFSLFEEDEGDDYDDFDSASQAHSSMSLHEAAPKRSCCAQFLWILLGVGLTAGGAWCGVQFGTRPQLAQLEAKLKSLEARVATQNVADASADAFACSADASSPSPGDRRNAELASPRPASEEHVASIPPEAKEEPVASTAKKEPAAKREPAAATAAKKEPAPAAPATTQPAPKEEAAAATAPSVVSEASESSKTPAVHEKEFPELTCNSIDSHGTPREGTPEWLDVRGNTWKAVRSWEAGSKELGFVKKESEKLLHANVHQLQSVLNQVDVCGMGRLCMSLLAMLAGDDTGSLKDSASLHSPLLTILLDVPWPRVMRSGWPLFGLLAQLTIRKGTSEDKPGKEGHILRYFRSLRAGLAQQLAPEALAELGANFVAEQEEEEAMPETSTPRLHVMPALCALASQLLGPDVLGPGRADAALLHMQGFFKQAVTDVSDLQGTVESSWPLHAVLHQVSVRLMRIEG